MTPRMRNGRSASSPKEHHVDPSRRHGLFDGGLGMPRNPPRCHEPFREPVVGLIDQTSGLPKLLRRGESVADSGCVVAVVVVECVRGLPLVHISELFQHLVKRPHPRGEVTDHLVHLGGLIECGGSRGRAPAAPRTPPQRRQWNRKMWTSWTSWHRVPSRCARRNRPECFAKQRSDTSGPSPAGGRSEAVRVLG